MRGGIRGRADSFQGMGFQKSYGSFCVEAAASVVARMPGRAPEAA